MIFLFKFNESIPSKLIRIHNDQKLDFLILVLLPSNTLWNELIVDHYGS